MCFLYSVYNELTAFTCFEHYLLIFRRRYLNSNWYIACVLCRVAATGAEVEHTLHTRQQPADTVTQCLNQMYIKLF
jgi:hypothetical protein